MRHRTAALLLTAGLMLAGCGTHTNRGAVPTAWPDEAGGPATPPTVTAESSTTPIESPTATPTRRPRMPTRKPRVPRTRQKTHRRPAPKLPVHPAGATARCRDGSYSYAKHHRGACSHHKGVAVWYR